MPVPAICCTCGGESCAITLCFAASCIEPDLEDVPLSEFTVTVTLDGETEPAGTCTLEPGHNCFTFDVAGTYHWTVRRGEQSRTGTVKLTCGSSKTIYVSLFESGYTVAVFVQGCPMGGDLEDITVTYTDGNVTLTAVTAYHSAELRSFALFENLADPRPAEKPFSWTVTIPAQCNFRERVVKGTFTAGCNQSLLIGGIELTPAPDFLCDGCTGNPYPCSETLTLTGVFGTHTLQLCEGYDHAIWQGMEIRTVGYTSYVVLYAFGCRSLLVWTCPLEFTWDREDPCTIKGSWKPYFSEHDPLEDNCEHGCHASGWFTADPDDPVFYGLSGGWVVE